MNLLRYSQQQPKISSYACLHGNYDFNHSPVAPPGKKTIVHENPDQCKSWRPHGLQVWYIIPATEHYRCHKFYIPSTQGVRDVLKFYWFPKQITLPKVLTEDKIRQNTSDMLAILSEKDRCHKITLLDYGSDITNSYTKISKFLSCATQRPPAPNPTVTKNTSK